MWVNDVPVHFVVYNGSQKNLMSAEVVKKLKFSTTRHPQPYTIGWLSQGRDLCINEQCHFPYRIKPFKDEVLCDIAPLQVSDVLLGQPYMWKCHVVYESRPRSVIITFRKRLYRIPEVAPKDSISLISTKECRKFITQNRKFVIFMVHSQSKKNILVVSTTSTQSLATYQK
jgi:hypothetical protein